MSCLFSLFISVYDFNRNRSKRSNRVSSVSTPRQQTVYFGIVTDSKVDEND